MKYRLQSFNIGLRYRFDRFRDCDRFVNLIHNRLYFPKYINDCQIRIRLSI